MTDSHDVNGLIDDVARRMTRAESSSDLRSRVLDRLDDRAPMRWAWTLVPAVVGLAILVVAVVRSTTGPSPGTLMTSVTSRASNTDPSRGPSGNVEAPIGASVDSPTSSVLRVVSRTGRSGSTGLLEGQEQAIPVLEAPAPLTVESIQPPALEIRPLYTAPLIVPSVDDDEGRR